jgi:hypothetical protein
MNQQDFITQASELINHLDAGSAYKFFNRLKPEEASELVADVNAKEYFYQLQFLISNFLSEKEVNQLFSKHLVVALKSDDFDLVALTQKLFVGRPIFTRDARKEELSKILAGNKEVLFDDGATLISEKKFTTVGDWLLSYTSEVGFPGSIFKESQYFSKYLNNLPDDKKIVLKKLFNLFKYLSNSSTDPKGFEDDLLLRDEAGRLVTTHKGRVIVLFDPNDKSKAGSSSSYSPHDGSVDKKFLLELKKFSDLKSSNKISAQSNEIIHDEKFVDVLGDDDNLNDAGTAREESVDKKKSEADLSLETLNSALANYSPSSLEYKAIKEEITRLRKKQS